MPVSRTGRGVTDRWGDFGARLGSLRGVVAQRLMSPVDASGLAAFRVVFGLIVAWEAWQMLRNGWVPRYFSDRPMYFTYWPFDWVAPLPTDFMFLVVALVGIFALFVAFGLFHRVSAVTLAVLLTYIFLLEKARFLNHFYLVCLLAWILAAVPANRCWSLDAWFNRGSLGETVPTWSLWLVRFQLAVPMVFGGLAKLNWDWLRGEPMRMWLSGRSDFPLLGQWFDDPALVWTMVYGAIAIDLLFLGYILNRRTRVLGYGVLLLFHLVNERLWSIGIFPWMMIGATLIFFPADWPKRVLADFREGHRYRRHLFVAGALVGAVVGLLWARWPDVLTVGATALGFAVFAYHFDEPMSPAPARAPVDSKVVAARAPAWAVVLAAVWIAVQVILPIRHYFIPGNASWTEQGHNFAWHMMLRSKESYGKFAVYDSRGVKIREFYAEEELSPEQAEEMLESPEMVWQFARYVERKAWAEGLGDVGVHAYVLSSLNGRPLAPLVLPEVDLTRVGRPIWGAVDWIGQYDSSLPPGPDVAGALE